MKIFNCKHCNETVKRNYYSSNFMYCSNLCQKEYEGKKKVDNWLNGNITPTKSIVARYLKENYGYNCEQCGINEWRGSRITLEIDHIDGNSSNNSPSNFRYLCPNCHALTSSYKGRNKGKGRLKRFQTIQ